MRTVISKKCCYLSNRFSTLYLLNNHSDYYILLYSFIQKWCSYKNLITVSCLGIHLLTIFLFYLQQDIIIIQNIMKMALLTESTSFISLFISPHATFQISFVANLILWWRIYLYRRWKNRKFYGPRTCLSKGKWTLYCEIKLHYMFTFLRYIIFSHIDRVFKISVFETCSFVWAN